jgi:hypothetical protein
MEEVYDIVFSAGVLAGIQVAVVSLMERGLNDAAAIVLATPRPTRAETFERAA